MCRLLKRRGKICNRLEQMGDDVLVMTPQCLGTSVAVFCGRNVKISGNFSQMLVGKSEEEIPSQWSGSSSYSGRANEMRCQSSSGCQAMSTPLSPRVSRLTLHYQRRGKNYKNTNPQKPCYLLTFTRARSSQPDVVHHPSGRVSTASAPVPCPAEDVQV